MASRESSRNPPFCFFSPWHLKQCSARSGRISFSKNAFGPEAFAAGSPAPALELRGIMARKTRISVNCLIGYLSWLLLVHCFRAQEFTPKNTGAGEGQGSTGGIRKRALRIDAQQVERGRENIFGRDRRFFHVSGVPIGTPDEVASPHTAARIDLGVGARPMVSACATGPRIDLRRA